MATLKNKVVNLESLKELHQYNNNTFANKTDILKLYVRYSSVKECTLNEIFKTYKYLILDENLIITSGCDYDINIIGENKNIYISGEYHFKKISISNANIIDNGYAALIYHGGIYLDYCYVTGKVRFILEADTISSRITHCKFENLEVGTFVFIDYSFDTLDITDNTVYDFTGVFVNAGINNEKISLSTRKIINFKRNIIDGGAIKHLTGDDYYTPLLSENDTVYFTENKIVNITDDNSKGNPTYWGYLSSSNVIVENNYFKEIHSLGTLYNTFIKAKGGGGLKRIANNYFEDSHKVSLLNIVSESTWIILDNEFHVDELIGFSTYGLLKNSIIKNCRFYITKACDLSYNLKGLYFYDCDFFYGSMSFNVLGTTDKASESAFDNCTFTYTGLEEYNPEEDKSAICQCDLKGCTFESLSIRNNISKDCIAKKRLEFKIDGSVNIRNVEFKKCLPMDLRNITTPCVLKVRNLLTEEIDVVKITKESNGVFKFNGENSFDGKMINQYGDCSFGFKNDTETKLIDIIN